MIRLPELLDSTLSPVRRLQPVKESIRLNLTPLSAADMDLLPGDTIPDRSFVRLYTIQGMAGIFRASEDRSKKKFYALVEFPYPSGAGMHVGHGGQHANCGHYGQ